MTNKEKYKQAFSVLHTSDISEGEVKYMAKLKKQQKMKLAAAAIAVCVIVGGTGTAYAANVGGIQRTIQLWMHGDQTSATLDLNTDNGSYSLEYKDTDGNTVTQGGCLRCRRKRTSSDRRRNYGGTERTGRRISR